MDRCGLEPPAGTVVADLVDAELDQIDLAHLETLQLVALSAPISRAEVVTALGEDADEALDELVAAGLLTTQVHQGRAHFRVAEPVYGPSSMSRSSQRPSRC